MEVRSHAATLTTRLLVTLPADQGHEPELLNQLMEKLKTNPMAATGGPKYADPVCRRRALPSGWSRPREASGQA
jgi:hypothetical protein